MVQLLLALKCKAQAGNQLSHATVEDWWQKRSPLAQILMSGGYKQGVITLALAAQSAKGLSQMTLDTEQRCISPFRVNFSNYQCYASHTGSSYNDFVTGEKLKTDYGLE